MPYVDLVDEDAEILRRRRRLRVRPARRHVGVQLAHEGMVCAPDLGGLRLRRDAEDRVEVQGLLTSRRGGGGGWRRLMVGTRTVGQGQPSREEGSGGPAGVLLALPPATSLIQFTGKRYHAG